jgi:hypothetical protein
MIKQVNKAGIEHQTDERYGNKSSHLFSYFILIFEGPKPIDKIIADDRCRKPNCIGQKLIDMHQVLKKPG